MKKNKKKKKKKKRAGHIPKTPNETKIKVTNQIGFIGTNCAVY